MDCHLKVDGRGGLLEEEDYDELPDHFADFLKMGDRPCKTPTQIRVQEPEKRKVYKKDDPKIEEIRGSLGRRWFEVTKDGRTATYECQVGPNLFYYVSWKLAQQWIREKSFWCFSCLLS